MNWAASVDDRPRWLPTEDILEEASKFKSGLTYRVQILHRILIFGQICTGTREITTSTHFLFAQRVKRDEFCVLELFLRLTCGNYSRNTHSFECRILLSIIYHFHLTVVCQRKNSNCCCIFVFESVMSSKSHRLCKFSSIKLFRKISRLLICVC